MRTQITNRALPGGIPLPVWVQHLEFCQIALERDPEFFTDFEHKFLESVDRESHLTERQGKTLDTIYRKALRR